MPSNSRVQLERWLKEIEITDMHTVIDIGGEQKPVKGRTKSWNPLAYDILDLPEAHESKAEKSLAFDIQEPVSHVFDKLYNVAFCLEVSEYWYDPLAALKNIATLLEKSGVLYISFHFIYPPHKPAGQDYLRYTGAGAVKLLEMAGFGEFEITPRVAKDSDMLKDFYQSEGMKAVSEVIDEPIGWLIKCAKI